MRAAAALWQLLTATLQYSGAGEPSGWLLPFHWRWAHWRRAAAAEKLIEPSIDASGIILICFHSRSHTAQSANSVQPLDVAPLPVRTGRDRKWQMSPKLVSPHDFALYCRCRLVSQACLPSWFRSSRLLPPCLPNLSPFMNSLLAAAAALSPKLVSLHDFALGCR